MFLRPLALGALISTLLASAAGAEVVTLDFNSLDGEEREHPGLFYAGGQGGQGGLGSGPGPVYGITFSADALVACTLQFACDDPEASQTPTNVLRFLDPRASFLPDPAAPSLMNVAGGFRGTYAMLYATNTAGSFRIWSGLNGTGTILRSVQLGVTEGCHDVGANVCLFAPVETTFQGLARSVEFVGIDFDLAGFDHITLDLANSAAPEPAAWALMIAGFGLAGATLRRRRALAA